MRKGEIAALTPEDIRFDEGYIRIPGSFDSDETKGGEDDPVAPLPAELATLLRAWLAHREAQQKDQEEPSDCLVINTRGNPISDQTRTGQLARAACRRAGLPYEVTFHQAARHTAGAILAQRNALGIVGQVLRHKDPRTTKRYEHFSAESLVKRASVQISLGLPQDNVVPLRGRSKQK